MNLSEVPLEIPCPNCRQENLKPVSELIANDSVACSFCGMPIDVSNEDWRTRIEEFADSLRNLDVISPKGE